MKSPIIRATCGCIVIPLHRSSTKHEGCMDCLLLKSCDEDQEWGFSIRPMEKAKVVFDPNHKYREGRVPAQLTEEETEQVIRAIGGLVYMGHKATDISHALSAIAAERKAVGGIEINQW